MPAGKDNVVPFFVICLTFSNIAIASQIFLFGVWVGGGCIIITINVQTILLGMTTTMALNVIINF